MTKKPSLNERQRRFVEAYARTGNATQSYIEAGYKARGNAAESSASKLLRIPKVAAAIEKDRQKRASKGEKLWAKAERTLEKILDDHEGERSFLTGQGAGSSSFRPLATAGEAAKAVDILAKIHGKFAPQKTELTGPDGGPLQVVDWEAFEAGLKRLAGEGK